MFFFLIMLFLKLESVVSYHEHYVFPNYLTVKKNFGVFFASIHGFEKLAFVCTFVFFRPL